MSIGLPGGRATRRLDFTAQLYDVKGPLASAANRGCEDARHDP